MTPSPQARRLWAWIGHDEEMMAARPRLRTIGAVIAALLVLLVALSPTLLFGETLNAFGLVLMGAIFLGIGLLLRGGGGAGLRTFGASLLIIGAVILAFGVGLTALLLMGWGRW
jgi:hypothetical protein